MNKTNKYVNLGIEFEKFCKELLTSLGYDINSKDETCDYYLEKNISINGRNFYPDIIIRSHDKSVYIDIKIFRTMNPDYSMLVQTAERLKDYLCDLND